MGGRSYVKGREIAESLVPVAGETYGGRMVDVIACGGRPTSREMRPLVEREVRDSLVCTAEPCVRPRVPLCIEELRHSFINQFVLARRAPPG